MATMYISYRNGKEITFLHNIMAVFTYACNRSKVCDMKKGAAHGNLECTNTVTYSRYALVCVCMFFID